MHRVLIVDDEEDFLSLLSLAFEGEFRRMDVMSAASSEGAFQGISQFAPDLVITDLVMPGTGGIALIEKIKKVAPKMPIVAMSGYDDEIDLLQEKRPEIDLLVKPFDLDELARIVRSIFQMPH